jgi:hypothetical protein
MQQAVEVASNFTPNNTSLPSEILGAIANHIRLKRSVALDRVAFEECHKTANETFDELETKQLLSLTPFPTLQ